MPKETEFYNAASAADGPPQRATKAAEPNGPSSSLNYRVSSRPSDLVPSSTDAPEIPTRSPDTRLSTANVSALLKRMSKNSASRLSISGQASSAEGSSPGTTGKPKNARYTIVTEAGSPSKGTGATVGTPKLPQKLRQHVSRLRGQFALGSSSGSSRNLSVGGRSPSPTAPPNKASRLSMNSAAINSRRFSIAAVAAIQYSRRSNQLQQLQAPKEEETTAKPVVEVPKPPALPHEPTVVVSAGTFQDLLRPLQTSLSCASLNTGWSSDEEDEAEQLFRQSERESSRMLHVCCSIDNLMLSISDQAQEQKKAECIVREAARDLVRLFQFAMKQAISVIVGNTDDQCPNNNFKDKEARAVQVKVGGKEAQYAMEFLLEINERIGKLYEFARSVFVNEVEGFQQRIAQLEEELATAELRNEQLQTEIRDLRDFHEQNSVNAVNSFAVEGSGPRHQVSDNEDSMISALEFPEVHEVHSEGGEGEISALKVQCQELSRLLEMAKQEIRLSHHERDVQKARVAEISSALFHDSELGMLRNQLQSEKKRVRILESDNLILRESQQEQAMKMESLEALQAGSLISVASPSTVGRQSNGMIRSSIHTEVNSSTLVEQQSDASLNGSPDQCSTSASDLTVEAEDNQYNFTYSGVVQPGDGVQSSVVNWFTRIVNPPQPAIARNSRKKPAKSQQEQHPPAGMSRFLAELLMTDKQLATAKEETNIRRQGSTPTLTPPVRAQSARREGRSTEVLQVTDKKRRPRSAATTSASTSTVSGTSCETQDNPKEIVACCLQLVWVFYQRFLLAVEAQNLLATRGLGGDPNLGSSVGSSAGNPAVEPVSLSLIVFHFFLERCSRELDAARELEQFVRCVHNVRSASYKLELFCQFLDESCSRQELCFYLWLCQAMDDVKLGIPYEDPLPVNQDYNDEPTQFICVLKATFLARTIFRLLHFKVLCRPPSFGGSRRRRKPKRSPIKRSNSNAAIAVAPTSPPPGSPKRRHKTRLGELAAVLSPETDTKIPGRGGEEQEAEKKTPLYVAAQLALRGIIENNGGEPITLETFNNLLLQYAVVPPTEELSARLGLFYQTTGDEQKVPTDVFLALLMETYRFQLQWQHDQLRALFIHLNHQEAIQQRTAELLAKTEVANIKNGKRGTKEGKMQPKPGMKRRRSRDRAVENGCKYLRGLSRNVLRELLLQSGVVHDNDVAQVDIDWLFAELLKNAGGVAADITFDSVYDTLEKMRWLDSSKLRVYALGEVTKVTRNAGGREMAVAKTVLKTSSIPPTDPSPVVRAIRDKWRVYARHGLALCNNDPNVFVRRHSQRLLHYVDQALCGLVGESENTTSSGCGGGAIQCVREFLEFAWRVAAKRSSRSVAPLRKQTCLTEVFLISQALRATVDSIPGYDAQLTPTDAIDNAGSSRDKSNMRDALQSFYDTSRMNLKHICTGDRGINTTTASNSALEQHLHELESVLTVYAAHIAHLFQRFSEARFNCTPQVSTHRWRAMVYELGLVDLRHLPFTKLQSLFMTVAVRSRFESKKHFVTSSSLDQELGVGKTQFSELFVLIAVERHRVAVARKLEKARLAAVRTAQDDNKVGLLEAAERADRPGRIMAQFCREVLAPRAFAADNVLVERNFEAKLSCPLVGRALLEHRSFLRTIFFFYAKQDEVAADEQAALEEQALIRELQENGGQIDGLAQVKDPERSMADASAALLLPDPGSDFQLEKTKRSSMSFGEFQTFLAAFGLLEDEKLFTKWSNKVPLSAAQQIFSSVMSLDNDDTLQLEFDEFTAAVVALAVHLNPNPFSLWHQKLDMFATNLQSEWETQNEGNSSA